MTEPSSIPATVTTHGGSAPREGRRIKGLDALRGIAAVAVLVFHYTTNYQRLFKHAHGKPLFSLQYGAMGVQLFFIISGFVIFMTLEKTRKPIDFVRSRFSRLFPAYWAALVLTFLVLHLFPLPAVPGVDYHKYHPSLSRGILNLTMCQEMFGIGHVDAVYWTLQLELCFYFMMFVLFCTKQLARVEFYLIGALIFTEALNHFFSPTAPLLEHHHAINLLVSDLRLLLVCSVSPAPHCHLHVFLIGIMIYKLIGKFKPRYLVVVAMCLAYSAWREPGIDFYLTCAFAAAVFVAASGWVSLLENRVLLFLGFISYSLYLTHQNIGYELIHAMEGRGVNPNVAIVVAAAIAIAVASALTYGIEQPALRLLRGKKQKSTRIAGAAVPGGLPGGALRLEAAS